MDYGNIPSMRAIDAWVNVELPPTPTNWQRQAAELFGRPVEELFRQHTHEEVLQAMDRSSVERALLTIRAERPSAKVLKFLELNPGRFGLSALVDPRQGMKAVRALERVVRDHGVRLARIIPCLFNLPPDDRVYYPIYAKCVELGLPISLNCGLPGPPLPGRCQDPIHLDDVCLFFPELTVIMAHGADPWWELAIRLLGKHPNLHLMTSAYAPKALPSRLLDFMNGRGSSKVMFATDYPFLTMERCMKEAAELELSPESLDSYLYRNAARVLFGEEH